MMMVTAQGCRDFGKQYTNSLAVSGTNSAVVFYTVFTGAVQPMC